MSYIDLIEVKLYLGITHTNIDSQLNVFINEAEAIIDNICETNLLEQTYTQVGTVDNSSNVILNHSKINDIISVEIDGTATDYTYKGFGIISIDGAGDYEVVYKSGYTTVPNDIKLIAKEIVYMLMKQSNLDKGILGLNSKSSSSSGIVSGSDSYKDMYAEWNKRLDKYKLRAY